MMKNYWKTQTDRGDYRLQFVIDDEEKFKLVEKAAQMAVDGKTAFDVVEIPEGGIGALSDGYHTFNELYHHRAVLFSVICNLLPDKAWKSMLHHTGDMYDGMFIVGIETPLGPATYHYDIDPYWNMFHVKELKRAPEWDGHTAQDAIERMASLTLLCYNGNWPWISVKDMPPPKGEYVLAVLNKMALINSSDMHPKMQILANNGEDWWSDGVIKYWKPLPWLPEGGDKVDR